MRLEAGKTYRTRDGKEIAIVAVNTNAEIEHQAIGWIDGCAAAWHLNGRIFPNRTDDWDLIKELPQKRIREFWFNVYPDDGIICHYTEQNSIKFADTNILARVKVRVEFNDGDGLTDEEKARLE